MDSGKFADGTLNDEEQSLLRYDMSERGQQARLNAVTAFRKDCDIIIKIFEDYNKTKHSSTAAKAEYLKNRFLDAYPDFLDNSAASDYLPKYEKAIHILNLMDDLFVLGHRLLEPANHAYLPWTTIPFLECVPDINDIFMTWVHPDIEVFVEGLREKGQAAYRNYGRSLKLDPHRALR